MFQILKYFKAQGVYSGILVTGRCEWGQILKPKKIPVTVRKTQKKSSGQKRNLKKVQIF